MVDKKASDLHLAVGSPPMVRVDGDLERLKWRTLTEEEYESLLIPIAPEKPLREWRATGDTDFAYAMGEIARFRVNLFRQEHGSGAVLRMIPPRVLAIEELGLPAARRERRADPARPRPRDGPDGLGQVHDARGAPRLDQPDARFAHHHDRGPRGVHPPAREVRHLAPGARLRHADVRRRAQGGAARGSRRRPRRRAAGPRDDVDGPAGRRDGAPRLRDAPHELGRQGRGPPHRQLPRRGAGAGPDGPRRGPQGRRRPGPPQEEGRRARRGVRGAPRARPRSRTTSARARPR